MREKLIELLNQSFDKQYCKSGLLTATHTADFLIANDVVPVVRCKDCVHLLPLDRNCEFNTSIYKHCGLWHGEEAINVWHKYKKYYKNYSLVTSDYFCGDGERKDNGQG